MYVTDVSKYHNVGIDHGLKHILFYVQKRVVAVGMCYIIIFFIIKTYLYSITQSAELFYNVVLWYI